MYLMCYQSYLDLDLVRDIVFVDLKQNCMFYNIINFISVFFRRASGDCPKPADVKVLDVLNVLADISYKWNEIGLALKVDSNVLGGLKRGKESDVLKLHTVIKSWHMENPHNATWDIIISAVEGPIVNSKRTADKYKDRVSYD